MGVDAILGSALCVLIAQSIKLLMPGVFALTWQFVAGRFLPVNMTSHLWVVSPLSLFYLPPKGNTLPILSFTSQSNLRMLTLVAGLSLIVFSNAPQEVLGIYWSAWSTLLKACLVLFLIYDCALMLFKSKTVNPNIIVYRFSSTLGVIAGGSAAIAYLQ
jgi:hypothetical protein